MNDLLCQILTDGYKRNRKDRVDNRIHASNLINFCPREYALCHLKKAMYNDKQIVPIGRLITFAIGDAVHDSVKEVLKQEGILVAAEVPFKIDRFGFPVTGSCDGLLARIQKKHTILEIKSEKHEDFEERTSPKIDHECQISIYLWLAEEMKMKGVDYEKGLLLYVPKQEKRVPFKSYIVKRNDDYISAVIKKLNNLKTFSKNKKKVPQRMCNSSYTTMAKRCSMVNTCFEEKR